MWIHCVQCVTSGCRGGLRALGWISVLGLALACSGAEPSDARAALNSPESQSVTPGARVAAYTKSRTTATSPDTGPLRESGVWSRDS
jgi:hypothetical protein